MRCLDRPIDVTETRRFISSRRARAYIDPPFLGDRYTKDRIELAGDR